MDTLINQEFEDNIDNDDISSNSDNSEHMNDNLNIIRKRSKEITL